MQDEQRLQALVTAGDGPDWLRHARRWKEQGGKVLGVLSSYVPEEVLMAAGTLPVRLTGTKAAATLLADAYRVKTSTRYYTHVLESALGGEFDFMDGVVVTDMEEDLVRTYDVWRKVRPAGFMHLIHVPRKTSPLAVSFYVAEFQLLIQNLETHFGLQFEQGRLREAIQTANRTRELLRAVNELRKREVPALTGAEMLGVVLAATIMPKEDFNRELSGLLPFLEGRRPTLPRAHPRFLISSDNLDHREFLKLIEEEGVVAMDDLDPGSRYYWRLVDAAAPDALTAIAQRYLDRPQHPKLLDWTGQAQQVAAWAREYAIDGVIELVEMYQAPREFRVPSFRVGLEKAGIPQLKLERDYRLDNPGQLRTRVGAFREMLGH